MTGFAEFYLATRDAAVRAVLAAGASRAVAEDAVAEAYARACARWSAVEAHPDPFACQATQLRMPVPGTELSLVGGRETDSETSVLLLAGPGGLLAVCQVFNGSTKTEVRLTVANHPIYDGSLVLVRRFSEDAGRGRVVLSDGRKVPLVFANGYATAWLDRPEDVQADHLEVDLASGGHTDFPLPLR